VDSAAVALTEGDSVTVHVRLAFEPAASTTVLIGSFRQHRDRRRPRDPRFHPRQLRDPKAVHIRALQDPDAAADSAILRFQHAGIGHTDVVVGVTDDEVQSIEATLALVNVTEGDSAQFGVRLVAQPSGDFIVSVASLSKRRRHRLTLHPDIHDLQLVDLSAGDRQGDPGHQRRGRGHDGPALGGRVSNKDVTVNITDDDTQAIVTSVDTVFVTEGQTVQLTLTLAFQPVSVDQVVLSDFNTLVADVSPTLSYLFTSANSGTGFTISVTGAEDANTTTDGTVIRFASNEEGMADHFVVVIVADND